MAAPHLQDSDAAPERTPERRWGAALLSTALVLLVLAVSALALSVAFAVMRGRAVQVPFLHVAGTAPVPATLPEGAVIAVAGEACPPPWLPYPAAEGRFLLGAGGNGLDDGGTRLPAYRAGVTGGRAAVTLQIADIPPHTHRLAVGGAADGPAVAPAIGVANGKDAERTIAVPFVSKRPVGWRHHQVVDALEAVGGVVWSDGTASARRHATIPPFVAVSFCVQSSRHALPPLAGRF